LASGQVDINIFEEFFVVGFACLLDLAAKNVLTHFNLQEMISLVKPLLSCTKLYNDIQIISNQNDRAFEQSK
jgi:hypothetical protein